MADISRLNEVERRNLARVLKMQIVACRTMSQKSILPLLLLDESTKHIPVKTAHEWLKNQVDKHRAS